MNELSRSIEAAVLSPLRVDADQRAERSYLFTEDFIGFAGHFPDFPIVPGIVQILTAQALVETWQGGPLRLQAVEKAKFLVPLRPGQEIQVRCWACAEPTGQVYRARLSVGEQLAASFQLRFQGNGAAS